LRGATKNVGGWKRRLLSRRGLRAV